MKNELIIRKCLKCGSIVKVIEDFTSDDCGITCCNEKMKTLIANSTDAVVEKHVPNYEVIGDAIEVKVNHVMDEDHFIEWICLKTQNREEYIYLNPGEEAVVQFRNVKFGTLYAYCNKHGLWSIKIGE